ncbi:MAG TPA: hypothetical protein VLL52_02425 [Anaerolineae bacterium]|nr:hypothetical protein [Anaerolineae bacterium]
MNQWEHAILEWIWAENQIQLFLPNQPPQQMNGSYDLVLQYLNDLGQQGWEVATSSAAGNWLLWTLKRAL